MPCNSTVDWYAGVRQPDGETVLLPFPARSSWTLGRLGHLAGTNERRHPADGRGAERLRSRCRRRRPLHRLARHGRPHQRLWRQEADAACRRQAAELPGAVKSPQPWPLIYRTPTGLRMRRVSVFLYRSRSLGSIASRSASPNKLMPSTVSMIASPGKTAIHGAVVAYSSAPPCSIRPHAGTGSCTPSPR